MHLVPSAKSTRFGPRRDFRCILHFAVFPFVVPLSGIQPRVSSSFSSVRSYTIRSACTANHGVRDCTTIFGSFGCKFSIPVADSFPVDCCLHVLGGVLSSDLKEAMMCALMRSATWPTRRWEASFCVRTLHSYLDSTVGGFVLGLGLHAVQDTAGMTRNEKRKLAKKAKKERLLKRKLKQQQLQHQEEVAAARPSCAEMTCVSRFRISW